MNDDTVEEAQSKGTEDKRAEEDEEEGKKSIDLRRMVSLFCRLKSFVDKPAGRIFSGESDCNFLRACCE